MKSGKSKENIQKEMNVSNSNPESCTLAQKEASLFNTSNCEESYILGKLHITGLLCLFISVIWIFSSCDKNRALLNITQKKDSGVPAFARINDGSEIKNIINLNGAWKFKAIDETEWMNAVVPGTVQEYLIRVGRLEDPFYRDNELDAQWVEKKEWEYQRVFTVDQSFLGHDKILLDCRGLDLICELYVNDTLIAKTQNMFIEYEFDIKSYLHGGTNTIKAIFRSVLEWNRQQAASEPRVTWAQGNNTTNDALKGLLFFSRKEASDFGWDWGIRLLSCGIWKPIRLVAFDTGRIKELAVRQDLSNPAEAVLSISADIESYHSADMRVDVNVTLEGKKFATKSFPVKHAAAIGQISIPNPRFWWPNGWGEHPLYTVKAELYEGENFPTTSWADFDKIFYETIPHTAALYDPDRPYFPSCPHNPLDREQKRPNWQTGSGTVHTYEVWGGEKRFDAYSEMGKYRFVAEFGFQSLPHAETVRSFTKPEDCYFPSAILDHHNLTGRKPNQNQGNVRIATFTADMFRIPAGMINWITVSQILQGEGIPVRMHWLPI